MSPEEVRPETPLQELPPQMPPAVLTREDRQWGMLAHLAALAGLLGGGYLNFVGPLVIWLVKKDQSRFVDYHGKESLNFQLNILIYGLVLGAASFLAVPLTCGAGLLVTGPLLVAVMVFGIVMPIIAGLKANEGELYQYPLTFRIIK